MHPLGGAGWHGDGTVKRWHSDGEDAGKQVDSNVCTTGTFTLLSRGGGSQ